MKGKTKFIIIRMQLELALLKLQVDSGAEELLFWGKVKGKQPYLNFRT